MNTGKWLILALGIIIGATLPTLVTWGLSKPVEERNVLLNTKFTNPYLECNGVANSDPQLTKAKEKLKNYISEAQKKSPSLKISLYVRDLNNGPWIGINEKEAFVPASLIKVPILVYYLKLADADRSIFSKELIYDPSKMVSNDNLRDEIGTEYHLVPDQKYTVLDLLERMITYSDNHSADMLFLEIEKEKFNQMFTDLQFELDRKDGEAAISAKNYSAIFRVLYNADYVSREMSEFGLEILSRSAYQQGIANPIPNQIPVSAKFGVYDYEQNQALATYQVHDCGIIYQPNSPYVVCVMTSADNTTFEQQAVLISDVSRIIFEAKTLEKSFLR